MPPLRELYERSEQALDASLLASSSEYMPGDSKRRLTGLRWVKEEMTAGLTDRTESELHHAFFLYLQLHAFRGKTLQLMLEVDLPCSYRVSVMQVSGDVRWDGGGYFTASPGYSLPFTSRQHVSLMRQSTRLMRWITVTRRNFSHL